MDWILILVIAISLPAFNEMLYMASLSKIAKKPLSVNPKSFTIPASPETAIKAIIRFSHLSGYQVDYFDQQEGLLILIDNLFKHRTNR